MPAAKQESASKTAKAAGATASARQVTEEGLRAATNATGVRLEDFANDPAHALVMHWERVEKAKDLQDNIAESIDRLASVAGDAAEEAGNAIKSASSAILTKYEAGIEKMLKGCVATIKSQRDAIADQNALIGTLVDITKKQNTTVENQNKQVEALINENKKLRDAMKEIASQRDAGKLRKILDVLRGM